MYISSKTTDDLLKDSKTRAILAICLFFAFLVPSIKADAFSQTPKDITPEEYETLMDMDPAEWEEVELPGPEKIRTNHLIHCLAQEELIIHEQKFGGALYRLNQTLINELVSWNDIHLKPRYVRNVCSSGDFSPSVKLLEIILIRGEEVFDIDFDETTLADDGLRGYQIQEVRSFVERLPHIFFQYMGDLQLLARNPRCFQSHLPELKYFYERFQYLETHLNSESLIEEKGKLRSIFFKLKQIDSIIEDCRS